MAAIKPKLKRLFTDSVNEYGPLGNDTGADVYGHYRQWRESGNRPGQFLHHLLGAWEVGDHDWDDEDVEAIVEEMGRSERELFECLTRDDAIIALAFAQILVDGAAQRRVLNRALKAIKRQSHERMIEFRGWDDAKYRKKVLKEVEALLRSVKPSE
jgi:uncharacterized protein YfeS